MNPGATDLVLSDDIYDCDRLDVSKIPLLVTLCKIGEDCIIDPTAEEEECSVASLVVGVSCVSAKEGVIATIRTSGTGSLSQETMNDKLDMSILAALSLNKILIDTLEHDEQQSSENKVGFL